MNKNTKKWQKLYKMLDDAHISALKQLADITKSGELDGKELRANISILKNEKGEQNIENSEDIYKSLLEKINMG